MQDLIDSIARHPTLSQEAKQRLIALALTLLAIERSMATETGDLDYTQEPIT